MMDGMPNFGTTPEAYIPLQVVDPRTLDGIVVRDREWIVHDWLPVRAVTLLYGDGGVGKTLLIQQLMTSTAVSVPWCGLRAEPCRSFALFCEDDPEELHRRQDAINRHFGLSFADLEAMRWASGVGADNVLIRFDRDGTPHMTERFEDLKKQAKDHGARLVVIDTAADTFGGNENDRGQVRQYISNALGKLAQEINGAVLVNAHPSRTGLSTGDLDGGSTGWSNSSRSRWSLARAADVDGMPADPAERILTRRKANYASIGDTITLRWSDGVLTVPEGRSSYVDQAARNQSAEGIFLELLAKCDAANMPVSSSKNAGNFAPKVFSKRPDAGGFTSRDLDGAMARLFADGRIVLESYGRSGDERRRIAAAQEDEA